jgi:hypothetical protein
MLLQIFKNKKKTKNSRLIISIVSSRSSIINRVIFFLFSKIKYLERLFIDTRLNI